MSRAGRIQPLSLPLFCLPPSPILTVMVAVCRLYLTSAELLRPRGAAGGGCKRGWTLALPTVGSIPARVFAAVLWLVFAAVLQLVFVAVLRLVFAFPLLTREPFVAHVARAAAPAAALMHSTPPLLAGSVAFASC